LSLYVKGYNAPDLIDAVQITYQSRDIDVHLPQTSAESAKRFNLGPLFATINESGSTSRILGSKIELKLAKATPDHWPTLLSSASGSAPSPTPSAPALPAPTEQASTVDQPAATQTQPKRRNWDKLADDELEDKVDDKDPNAGGDTALNALFSQIYANADPDTKRAMIKSFTESGGTTLSTDWSKISAEKTPVRPPDGMEEKKYE